MSQNDSSPAASGGPHSTGPDELRKRLIEIEDELAQIFYELIHKRRNSTGVDGKTPDNSAVNLSLHLGQEISGSDPSIYSVLLGQTSIAQAVRATSTPGPVRASTSR